MATNYKNVGKPAFYIPFFDYGQSVGMFEPALGDFNSMHLLNPSKKHLLGTLHDGTTSSPFSQEFIMKNNVCHTSWIEDADGYVYIFILGHNLEQRNSSIEIQIRNRVIDEEEVESIQYFSPTETVEIKNYDGYDTKPARNGFSIYKAKYEPTLTGAYDINGFKIKVQGFGSGSNGLELGCASLCSRWVAPHSPDLSLTMTREYDGVKTMETKGGATLSQASYTRGGALWANGSMPWELTASDYDPATNPNHAHIYSHKTLGRRTWDLQFSYISDSDIMPEMENASNAETYTSSTDTQISSSQTLRISQTFFARVLNRVQGSHLPFIFQPNSDLSVPANSFADQWAICRFDQDSFEINQVANNVYNIKLKIRECW